MIEKKPKFVPITDPAMADELTKDPTDLSKPYVIKPNGQPWVDHDEFAAWKEFHGEE